MTGVWGESWLSLAETREHGFECVLSVEYVGVGGGWDFLFVFTIFMFVFLNVYMSSALLTEFFFF